MYTNQLRALLQSDIANKWIDVRKDYDNVIEFTLAKPIFDYGLGRIKRNNDGEIELTILSYDKTLDIEWNGHSAYESICTSYKVKYLCSADKFCHTSLSILRGTLGLGCGCEQSNLTHKQVVAIDLDYLEIPRKRGVVVVGKCMNNDCGRWRFDEFAIAVEYLKSKYEIMNAVSLWCDAIGVRLPNNKSIVDSYGVSNKGYFGSTGKRTKEAEKKKISNMKDMSLDEMKKYYYKR